MHASDFMHEILASDLDPKVKLVLYELYPYLEACPKLRRLIRNGGCDVYKFPGGVDPDSSPSVA